MRPIWFTAAIALLSICVMANAESSAKETRNVRIVDYGADMCGYVHNPYRGQSATAVSRIQSFIDKDQDGSLSNDTVSGWQYSLSEPLSFPYAPHYDLRQKSARLFGGIMLYAVNGPDRSVSEGFMNANHVGRDDFNFMGLGSNEPIPENEKIEGYALWCWLKPDFLSNGDVNTVRFDDKSFIAVHVSRYWGGIDSGRWVVRDGDQFFVSRKTFGDIDELIDGDKVEFDFNKQNPMTHQTFLLHPLDSEWGIYNPTEAEEGRHSVMDFDADNAAWEPREFNDVTSVGFLLSRRLAKSTRAVFDNLSPHQTIAVKWNAFRCDAVVERTAAPGHTVPLVPAKGALVLSRDAVSFKQWESIRRIGVTNQHPRGLGDLGYALLSDGVIGEMETDGKPHTTIEPVLGLTWLDAIAWCNMLSEIEDLEPAYYADAECKVVLRRVIDRSKREKLSAFPTVYWKQSAEGYRLPTREEWPHDGAFCWEGPEGGNVELRLARNIHSVAEGKVLSRQSIPVRTTPAAASETELRKLLQNELTMVILPIGIAIAQDADPLLAYRRQRAIGIARMGRFSGKISQEELDRVTRENSPPDYDQRRVYPLELGEAELSYRVWINVRQWAEYRGYRFNYGGDMGSMRTLFDTAQTFRPDEPVTNISWHDALIWCNAASELMGWRPVYYHDLEMQQPYREAVTFRIDQQEAYRYPQLPSALSEAIGRQGAAKGDDDTNRAVFIFMDAQANGYRLPFTQEFDKANPESTRTSEEGLTGQMLAEPGQPMRTRPVRAGQPDDQGLHEMNGNVYEWAWSPTGSHLDVMGKYALNGRGCFSMTRQQVIGNRSPYQELVYNARPYFGFRVARRAK